MMSFLMFHWKQMLFVVVTTVVLFFISNYKTLSTENVQLKQNVETLTTQLTEANDKLEIFNKAVQEQVKKQNKNEEDRRKLVKSYDEIIKNIQNQQISQVCTEAIEFAITHKGDLEWKK